MDTAAARAEHSSPREFEDGLGERAIVVDEASGETLETLRLCARTMAAPAFEFALRERAGRLANFRHAYYARVRRIDRDDDSRLVVVSEHVPGLRLSEMLRAIEEHHLELDINAALCLVRQLVPAVALLHENARDVAHGTLGPERVIVTPHARLVIAEYVLGSAIEQLQLTHDRLWKEFRIAAPPSAGYPRLDRRADVTQIGIIALSLVLGRPLAQDEFPHRLAELLAVACETSALGGRQPLSKPLRTWLARALQLDLRRSFATAIEAQAALDELLAEEASYVPAPVALESFLRRYHQIGQQQPPRRQPIEIPVEQPAAPALRADDEMPPQPMPAIPAMP
jgi:serine/threonine protein kinase